MSTPLVHRKVEPTRPHREPTCAPDCPACKDDATARVLRNRQDGRRFGNRSTAGRGRVRRRMAQLYLTHPLAGLRPSGDTTTPTERGAA